jgi:hypothetical protein
MEDGFIDLALLQRFEEGLNPQEPEQSTVPAVLIGYGEISTIFRIGQAPLAYKRLPLFKSRAEAEAYARSCREYWRLLEETDLTLPEADIAVVDVPGRPTVVYIIQEMFPSGQIGHKLLHTLPERDLPMHIERIVMEISKVRRFNRLNGPALEAAMDGQISNWACIDNEDGPQIYYLDTSMPFFKKSGRVQFDPELFLQAAPGFLRWIFRLFFVKGVVERYFIPRQVFIDLAANLYKEQRPELVPVTVEIINRHFDDPSPLSVSEVEKYYRHDKFIWTLFLSLRRFDRWLTTRVFKGRYEFILPGRIER